MMKPDEQIPNKLKAVVGAWSTMPPPPYPVLTECYDRQGHPITDLQQWIAKRADPDYKRVRSTILPSLHWVSTVWLGSNARLSGTGPPLIFETAVFAVEDQGDELERRRYPTEAEALKGHAALVKKWTRKP